MEPASDSVRAERRETCHQHILNLCRAMYDMGHMLQSSSDPQWDEVSIAWADLKVAREWLYHHWEVLEEFDGLRPDAVIVDGVGYRSWHAAVAERYLFNSNNAMLLVWYGNEVAIDEYHTCFVEVLDWSKSDCGLPDDESICRDREELWQRLRAMALIFDTASPRPAVMYPPQPTRFRPSGWMHVTRCNAWELIPNLQAEYQHSCQPRTFSPPPPPPPPPPRLTVDLERMSVTLDGVTHDVKSEQALRWVRVLANNPGQWYSSSQLEAEDAELIKPRTDRLMTKLPDPISKLIDPLPGKGSRICLA